MIQSDNFYLELATEKDTQAILEMFYEPEAFTYIQPLKDKTEKEYLDFIATKIKDNQAKTGFYWLIKQAHTQALIGSINVTPLPNSTQMQIGWQIKNAFKRQGYASRASKIAFDNAIEQQGITFLYAVFEKENIASKKVVEKLNFSFKEKIEKKGKELHYYIYQKE